VTFLLLGAAGVVVLQMTRRRPWRKLLAPDGPMGKAGLLVIPCFLLLRYMSTWVDYAWISGLTLAVLTAAYAATRRFVVTLLLTAGLITAAGWSQAPHLKSARHGDTALLNQLNGLREMGRLDGYQDLAVAKVDLADARSVRFANLGSVSETTPMEIGSLTKALTGLVIDDSIRRGELRLDTPVSIYLPQLRGSAAGEVTIRELVTHHAGYAEFGAPTQRAAAWSAVLGRNWIGTDLDHMFQEAEAQTLTARGTYLYSTLGAATAGQAAAAAAHMTYPDLMRTRLFGPLQMTHTAIQVSRAIVDGGQNGTGLAESPWVFDAYAPGGGAVSTAADLTRLATALLTGTAPGISALEPLADGDVANKEIGEFWQISHWPNGQDVTWHSGTTAGYSSYLGIDRRRMTAVIVLSDVSVDPGTTDLGAELLTTGF
jgi:CubicO group peptidase (beta-lactamase class C family)